MTCVATHYHSTGTKWHLAPDFTYNTLSESTSIANAIDIVLSVKNKHLSNDEKNEIINYIEKFVNGKTIKYLYNLNEIDWKNLNCIPLICKLYLRHLIVQSFKYYTKQQKLEYDFNFGIKYDWNNNENIKSMTKFGFSFDEACEAVIVTQNKSVNGAINYVLLDEHVKKEQYQRQKLKLNQMKLRTLRDDEYDEYFSNEGDNGNKMETKWKKQLSQSPNDGETNNANNGELLSEIKKFQEKLCKLKLKRIELENKKIKIDNDNKLILYQHYVNGILSEKLLNIKEITHWKQYREERHINNNQHKLILNRFGFNNDEDLDKIKTYTPSSTVSTPSSDCSCNVLKPSITTTTTISNSECVICYTSLSSLKIGYMLLPCNHICLCEECINKYYPSPHNDQKCPMDFSPVTNVKKVFFE